MFIRMRLSEEVARSDMRGLKEMEIPDVAEPVIGCAFARPVGSSGRRSPGEAEMFFR